MNGACNNSQRNSCSSGTANDAAIADTSTFYRWRCDGQNGGTNSGTCSKAKSTIPITTQPPTTRPPTTPGCDNTTRNGCTNGGNAINKRNAGNGYWEWQCDLNGVVSSQCFKQMIWPECNNDVQNTCTDNGIATNKRNAGNGYWEWQCASPDDSNLITSGQCSKRMIWPECNNDVQNTCTDNGIATNKRNAGNGYWEWQCASPDDSNFVPSGQCFKQMIWPKCNNTVQNGCTDNGIATNQRDAGNGYWEWQCASPDDSNFVPSGQCFIAQ